MTLRELIASLRAASTDSAVKGLIRLLEEWRESASTAEDLYQSAEKYIGNSWIDGEEIHKTIYSLWSAFRNDCITGRGGMTVNVRLYCFDLLDKWDRAKTDKDRAVVRYEIDFQTTDKGTWLP